MNLRKLKQAGMFLAVAGTAWTCAWAQITPPQPYTLIAGSQLTDDCLDCDRIPIVVSMTGTFDLQMMQADPVFTHFELGNIALHAGTFPGPEYKVTGRGNLQVGGEVALVQDLFLDLEIGNGVAKTQALCVNSNRFVNQPWPQVQIDLAQTNGTSSQVYYLTLNGVPVPALHVLLSGDQSGDVRLEWEGYVAKYQLERATNAAGPFEPLTPGATKMPFTDAGVTTNQFHCFYRLRQIRDQ